MRTLTGLVALAVPSLLVGCEREQLPPLEFHGERVVVGSDVVDEVCEGTLARLDREVMQIEDRLDLSAQDEPLRVYVLSPDTVARYCGDFINCAKFSDQDVPFAALNQHWFEHATMHELTHVRLAHVRSVSMLQEGVAEAISPPECPQIISPNLRLSDLLTAKVGGVGYYVAGEFVAWLLEEFGANTFMNFYASVSRDASAAEVQAQYRAHFGRDIEDDPSAYFRTLDDFDALAPEELGCVAPPAPTDGNVISLQATLSCDSDRVQTDFGVPGNGYVEWTLTLEHAQTFELVGSVTEWTSLSVQRCSCMPRRGSEAYLHLVPWEVKQYETLQPGTYRLRWNGALDEDLALDVKLVPID